MSYILKFEYSNKDITEQLIPWNNEINLLSFDEDISEYYQIGTVIKYDDNTVKIITPFFIQIPYSKCTILNTDITLNLISYCYYTRIAIYTVNHDFKEYINFNSINTNLSLDFNTYIKQIDKTNIEIINTNIIFENIMNENIYPFVWLNGIITNIDLLDTIIPGLPIYSNDIFIGIVYNLNDNIINIIPNINIILNLNNKPLSNIFFDYDLIVKQSYTKKTNNLQIGDVINSINDIKINKSSIYYDKLNIDIPINTYIWYEAIYYNVFNFLITRNNKKMNININTEKLNNKISFDINTISEWNIIDKFIFIKPNLLMIEWLIENDIILKNYLYLSYIINPYYKIKNNYLLIELSKYNIKLKPYIELYNIVSINNNKTFNINTLKYINKLLVLNSNEKQVNLIKY
jgi:hypothetical protein